MIYLTGAIQPAMHHHLDDGELGFINTPNSNHKIKEGWVWAADNGCFGSNYVGDEKWIKWLERLSPLSSWCLFATAPDVVGDGEATIARSTPWLKKIRDLGYPAALVAQDGMTEAMIPWADFDVLFIGGTTDWKLGQEVVSLIKAAQGKGKRVHVGRVNSWKRFHRFAMLGVESSDGTKLAFGPAVNLPKVLSWGRSIKMQSTLF